MPFYRDPKGTTTPGLNPTRKMDRSEEGKPKIRPRTPLEQPPIAANTVVAGPDIKLVVGWLAVIEGPGRGLTFPLGYGINVISRGPNAHIRLNFGDAEIAADHHAAIIYTAKARRFYVQPQAKLHRISVNGHPVQEPIELNGGETLTLGQTSLRFIPLCGPTFDWQR